MVFIINLLPTKSLPDCVEQGGTQFRVKRQVV